MSGYIIHHLITKSCECGCGTTIPIRNKNGFLRFVSGHNSRGKPFSGRSKSENQWGNKNSRWKGGRIVTKQGYVKIKDWSHPRTDSQGYVYEHIVVAEQKIGRRISDDESVHHINSNKQDNRPENLEVLTEGDHSRLHRHRERDDGRYFGRYIKKYGVYHK